MGSGASATNGTDLSSPNLQLQTLFILDADGRIASTREPLPKKGPLFYLIRSRDACAWAIRADISHDVAAEVNRLAREESPVLDREPPVHANAYLSLVGGHVESGPAFAFPDQSEAPRDVVIIDDEALLGKNFRGWKPGEIAAGAAPVVGVVDDGYPVSICFSARRSEVAAEAGVETAEAYRGRGYGSKVTLAWASIVRKSGLVPLYSTSWSNESSLSLTRKLNLVMVASDWSLSD